LADNLADTNLFDKDLHWLAVLGMTSLSHSPRDRILWTGQQRQQDGAKQIEGMHWHEELAREGRIKIAFGKHAELISLQD
jgi:hypothetical protein